MSKLGNVLHRYARDANRGEVGLFDCSDDNNPSIYFTKEDNPDLQYEAYGASIYRVLFEETYHAYQYEILGKVVNSCVSEAIAWKFSTLAPGTKMTYYNDKTGNLATTFMGQIHESSIPRIALGFKFGMPETLATSGIGGGLYSDIKLGSTSELKFFLGITF